MAAASDAIRLLYVDAEPDAIDSVTTSLERADDRFVTETATSAGDGLELLAEREFDCVISDYDLPRTNGVAFLEAVREAHPALPFILFTGTGSEEIASQAVSAGVTDYLRKGSGADAGTVLGDRILDAVDSARSGRGRTDRTHKLRKYERMVNTMQEAACIYDAEGRFDIANEYLADWYGTTREEIEGRQSSLVSNVRRQGQTDRYEELLDGDRTEIHGELEDEFPGHGRAVLEYRLTPLTVNGSIEGAVGVARDITEHRERERELRRQNERLDEFASVVSHDLRNPLQLADGGLELARAECDSEHLEHVDRALDRMDALIGDLLTLARGDETATDLDRVDLATTAEESWATLETADATLVIDTDRAIDADRSRLRQVFENLMRNAIEHGGEDATVTVGDLDDGFYVEDDGPGIAETDREDAFDAGFSTTEGGTGFGLSIVDQAVGDHGWEIAVSDGRDGGARFEITGVTDATE